MNFEEEFPVASELLAQWCSAPSRPFAIQANEDGSCDDFVYQNGKLKILAHHKPLERNEKCSCDSGLKYKKCHGAHK